MLWADITPATGEQLAYGLAVALIAAGATLGAAWLSSSSHRRPGLDPAAVQALLVELVARTDHLAELVDDFADRPGPGGGRPGGGDGGRGDAGMVDPQRLPPSGPS